MANPEPDSEEKIEQLTQYSMVYRVQCRIFRHNKLQKLSEIATFTV